MKAPRTPGQTLTDLRAARDRRAAGVREIRRIVADAVAHGYDPDRARAMTFGLVDAKYGGDPPPRVTARALWAEAAALERAYEDPGGPLVMDDGYALCGTEDYHAERRQSALQLAREYDAAGDHLHDQEHGPGPARTLATLPAHALVPVGGDHVVPVVAGRVEAVTDRDDDVPTGYRAYDAAGRFVGEFDAYDDADGVLGALALKARRARADR